MSSNHMQNNQSQPSSRFANLVVSKKIEAFGLPDVEIRRLSPNQLANIQEATKKLAEAEEKAAAAGKPLPEVEQFKALLAIVREGTPEMANLTDAELLNLPLADLKEHAETIMEYSGMGKDVVQAAVESQKTA